MDKIIGDNNSHNNDSAYSQDKSSIVNMKNLVSAMKNFSKNTKSSKNNHNSTNKTNTSSADINQLPSKIQEDRLDKRCISMNESYLFQAANSFLFADTPTKPMDSTQSSFFSTKGKQKVNHLEQQQQAQELASLVKKDNSKQELQQKQNQLFYLSSSSWRSQQFVKQPNLQASNNKQATNSNRGGYFELNHRKAKSMGIDSGNNSSSTTANFATNTPSTYQSSLSNSSYDHKATPSTLLFRDRLDSRRVSDSKLLNCLEDERVGRKLKIHLHLLHNQQQMQLITSEVEQKRTISFENFYQASQLNKITNNSSSQLMQSNKSTEINSTHHFRFYHSLHLKKQPTNNNNNNSYGINNNSQINIKNNIANNSPHSNSNHVNSVNPLLSHTLSIKTSAAEEDNNNSDQYQPLKDLVFHWEKVVNYHSELRPNFREAATLVTYNNKFYLFGGFGVEVMNSLYEFNLKEYQWRKVECIGDMMPSMGRYGHSANLYKNSMLIFGGGCSYNVRLKTRVVMNEMWIFDFTCKEWKLLKTSGDYIEPRRNHAACIVGSNFFVFGGVNIQEKSVSSISVLQMDRNKWKNYCFKQDEAGIAFQTVYPVFKKYLKQHDPVKYKKQLNYNSPYKPFPLEIKEEGVYCFGGKQGNEKIRNRLMVLKCDIKDAPVEWIYPETEGLSPPCRYQHSIFYNDYLNSLGIFGGRSDQHNQIYNDIWMLGLSNLAWIQIPISGAINRSRFAHAATIIDQRLYIFGGASDKSFTDCELYVLDMDQFFAKKKEKNQVRNFITRQESLMRINIEGTEGDGEVGLDDMNEEKNKQFMLKSQKYKTFLRPPTKDQLKLFFKLQDPLQASKNQQYLLFPDLSHKMNANSYDSSPRTSGIISNRWDCFQHNKKSAVPGINEPY